MCWDLISNNTCKLRTFWFYQSEALSQYLLIALALERVISLYRPFAVRLWATKRNAWLLLTLLFTASAIVATPAIFNHEIVDNPLSDGQLRCHLVFRSPAHVASFICSAVLLILTLPRFTVLILTVILSRKIRGAAVARRVMRDASLQPVSSSSTVSTRTCRSTETRSRTQSQIPAAAPQHIKITLQQRRNASSILQINRNNCAPGAIGHSSSLSALQIVSTPAPPLPLRLELRLARPVYAFAMLELLLLLQLVVAWCAFFLIQAINLGPEWSASAAEVAQLSFGITIVSRFWNLYILSATIPAFRLELMRMISCRCCSDIPLRDPYRAQTDF